MKHFSISSDPIRDFEKYDAMQTEWLESRPVCSVCGEYIQEEIAYVKWEDRYKTPPELICEDCVDEIEGDLQIYYVD